MVHDHLVEADRAGHGARPAAEGHLEDRPLFDPVVAVEEPLQPLLEVLRLDLRQESKPAEVHPEQGNALWSSEPRAGEECPVAAERDHQLACLEAAIGPGRRRIAIGFDNLHAPSLQDGDGTVHDRLLGARPTKNADDQLGARWTNDSRLPYAPISSDAASPATW